MPIPSAPGYEAHWTGLIRRGERILIDRGHPRGYRTVDISVAGKAKTRTVHRLVCEAWHGVPGDRQVNHLNGSKADNRAVNLEWCTARENVEHAINAGLRDRIPSGMKNSPLEAGYLAAKAAGRNPVDSINFGAVDRVVLAEIGRYQSLPRRRKVDRERLRAALIPFMQLAGVRS